MHHLLLVLLFGLGATLGACGSGGSSPAEPELRDRERQEEREKKARQLFIDASRAVVPEKVRLLKKIIAFYPDTKVAPAAHHHLVFYLVDPVVDRRDEAYEAAVAFAARHPDDMNVVNSFHDLVGVELRDEATPDSPRMARALQAWAAHMARMRKRAEDAPADRRAEIWYWSAECAIYARRYQEAREALEQAVSWKVEDPNIRKRILVRLAGLHARRPGGREVARKTLEEAIALTRSGATRGATVEDLQKEIRKLDR